MESDGATDEAYIKPKRMSWQSIGGRDTERNREKEHYEEKGEKNLIKFSKKLGRASHTLTHRSVRIWRTYENLLAAGY